MHQKEGRDFRGIGKLLLEAKPKTGSPIRGVGKRCYITLIMKERHMGLEFFVENVVTAKPGDPGLGFTFEDLNLFHGVAIYDIDDGHEHTRTYGEVLPIEDFLKKYVHDDKSRIMILGCMGNLEEEAQVKQGFIDRINHIWQERDVAHQELYSKRSH